MLAAASRRSRQCSRRKRCTIYIYPDVKHGFNNDIAGPRYDKTAAGLAWSRTVTFFKQELGEPPKAG